MFRLGIMKRGVPFPFHVIRRRESGPDTAQYRFTLKTKGIFLDPSISSGEKRSSADNDGMKQVSFLSSFSHAE